MTVCIEAEPKETLRFKLANQQPTSSRLQDSTNHEGGGLQCIFCLHWTREDSSSAEDHQRTWHSDIDKRFKNLNYLNGCAYRDSGIISTFEGEAPSSENPQFTWGKWGSRRWGFSLEAAVPPLPPFICWRCHLGVVLDWGSNCAPVPCNCPRDRLYEYLCILSV